MSMKKFAASVLALALLAGCSSGSASGNTDSGSDAAEAFESTLYPTPEGVTYTASGVYNQF